MATWSSKMRFIDIILPSALSRVRPCIIYIAKNRRDFFFHSRFACCLLYYQLNLSLPLPVTVKRALSHPSKRSKLRHLPSSLPCARAAISVSASGTSKLSPIFKMIGFGFKLPTPSLCPYHLWAEPDYLFLDLQLCFLRLHCISIAERGSPGTLFLRMLNHLSRPHSRLAVHLLMGCFFYLLSTSGSNTILWRQRTVTPGSGPIWLSGLISGYCIIDFPLHTGIQFPHIIRRHLLSFFLPYLQ